MRRPQGQQTVKRLNVSKLKSSKVAEDFFKVLESKLKDTVEDDGTSIEEHTRMTPPPPQVKKDALVNVRQKVQKKLREMQDTWFSNKRKGNRQSCDDHRGISLLFIAEKILARLLQHLQQEHFPEFQCGFRTERCTADMIFATRQLQEKCQEQDCDLYMTFFDLTKAFDTVSRDGLWKIMEKFGCPSKFVTFVRQFHDGMIVKVLGDGDESEASPVTNSVKQGCILAPTLFNRMFSAMLNDAFQDCEDGTDRRIFNLLRLQAVTKGGKLLSGIFCLLMIVPSMQAQQMMQHEMDCFSRACDSFGLTISTKKD
ncbi:uncharacterized protein LOC130047376 [Ostrea edulis]|uniref:uncharacterized protein LOC130047376 n=1 Tax=Ostrea edulis TaxID=37623 RepID=UPI0024AFF72B|nr:uncharacterized protein LOC130047376 [Ostrea edulis]